MARLECCYRCIFFAHSLYLVCAEHPEGVEGPTCKDFQPNQSQTLMDEGVAWYGDRDWQPVGASYYGDELILDLARSLSEAEQMRLLETHPFFTGQCPNCGRPILETHPPRIHWDCDHCGWIDDSV